jgi:predicted AAA+ superfamily ATPase
MKEFGRQSYNKTVNINFDSNVQMTELFSVDLNVESIIMGSKLYAGFKINPSDTLIIFDEVQEVPKALSSLKYFYEDAPPIQYCMCRVTFSELHCTKERHPCW